MFGSFSINMTSSSSSSSVIFTLLLFISLLLTTNPKPSLASIHNNIDDDTTTITLYTSYLKNACSVTRYRGLCIQTLWPFTIVAANNSSKWARAGVTVTITYTKHILRLLHKTRHIAVENRQRIALSDCRELFVDSLDNLYKSLDVLRKLDDDDDFQRQMSDLATWLSAALTDDDTCLDGFEEAMISSWTVRMIRRKADKCMQLCSNALALLNNLVYD